MASSSIFSLNFTPISSSKLPAKHQFTSHSYFPCISFQNSNKKRQLSLPSVASIPYQPINVDYLKQEFSGHGVTFEDIGVGCTAKIRTENGSIVTLMLPNGLITSYKPRMWHGGKAELLQTSVLEAKDGSPLIQGGLSLAFNFCSDGELPWSPSSWALRSITGTPDECIEVELISTDADEKVDVKQVITLTEDTLVSELVVSNRKSSSIQLMGSIMSHLTVSTPEATYAFGLEGSDYYSKPMLMSDFSIVPPDVVEESGFGFDKLGENLGLYSIFPGWGGKNLKHSNKGNGKVENEHEIEGEEDENYKQLTDEMSRIYTSAPSNFILIDRGRRNSVEVGRGGFDELYMYSPGSSHDSYSMYSYICVGQAAMLKPITVNPGEVWTGGQQLHNPNL